MLNKSTRPISTGLSEISETSHEPNSTQESESLDLADIESRDVTQYDDDSDRIGFKKKIKWDTCPRWPLSLNCPMRNSDENGIGKTHLTLLYEPLMIRHESVLVF